ncbi:hypothetical protein RND81_11G177200 [Saponaria officinalis]|uniref:Reverse transcriptase zinc-binding domain-containing protein n=1 Tax=Saponaria officinalis TaxID=3572 RepID=A0AAW1HMJ2_SAPOF
MHITTDTMCDLCGIEVEDHRHLFCNCAFSLRVMLLVEGWSRVQLPQRDALGWLCAGQQGHQEDWVAALVLAVCYHIWWARNTCRLQLVVMRPECVVERIMGEFEGRLKMRRRQRL